MTLSEILIASGKTQEVLAERFGVFQTTVGTWIRGTSQPPSTRLPAIAAGLGLTLDEVKAAVETDRQKRLAIARQVLADAEAKAANAPATARQDRSAGEAAGLGHAAQPSRPGHA